MNAYELENGMDELFMSASQLTPKQAETIGAFRAILWEKQEEEKKAVQRALRGAIWQE